MTSFETINLNDYKKLVANEKKIFDLTENFTTSEILNKYRRSDKNIDKKIREKEKYENLDKIINKNKKIQLKIFQIIIIIQMGMMKLKMINIWKI